MLKWAKHNEILCNQVVETTKVACPVASRSPCPLYPPKHEREREGYKNRPQLDRARLLQEETTQGDNSIEEVNNESKREVKQVTSKIK